MNPGTDQSSATLFGAESASARSAAAERTSLRRGLEFRPKLWASYCCALLMLAVGIVAVIQNHEAEAALARANLLRNTIRRVLETEVLLLEAETGQRGYLLTADARYRAPYDGAAPKIEAELDALRAMVRDQPQQLARVDRLRAHVRQRLDMMGQTLRVHDAGGDGAARLKQAGGHELMQSIRRETQELVQGARAERDVQSRRASLLYGFARWFTGFGNLSAFLLAVAVTFWIGRAFRDSQSARLALEGHALELERSSHKLAEQERALAARLREERRLSASLERSNAALQKSNADLEFFAYMASHDLRAPLRGIANVSEWIEQDLGGALPKDTKRHMVALRGRVHRLEALISAIAAYARAGKRVVKAEALNLDELLHELVEALAKPAGVELRWRSPLPVLRSVREPLQQVLSNLISNAIKHGSQRGDRIEFELGSEAEFWRLSIRDNGPGIAPEYHDKIFGLFQTLAARDNVEGTGMGLAIVKKLVDQYGGEVSVSSLRGAGATFSVKWPKRMVEHEANERA